MLDSSSPVKQHLVIIIIWNLFAKNSVNDCRLPYGLINYTSVYTSLEKYTKNSTIFTVKIAPQQDGLSKSLGSQWKSLAEAHLWWDFFHLKSTRGVWPFTVPHLWNKMTSYLRKPIQSSKNLRIHPNFWFGGILGNFVFWSGPKLCEEVIIK